MKLGRRKKDTGEVREGRGKAFSKPSLNQYKKDVKVVGIIAVTALLILWVLFMGRKAERTVDVVMLATNIHKNQVVTEELLMPYKMLQGEFEKFSIVERDGSKRRRVLLWEERNKILNSFAAYPLKAETYAEYRDFVKSRTDNSDSVLYSFPGKDIIPLMVPQSEMDAFKTFLKPGDRLNVQAVFSEKINVVEDDGWGGTVSSQVDTFKTDDVFKDIMVSDLLNHRGESILDIYTGYRDMSVWDQARMDSSPAFREQTQPKTLLVALTPEEKERYYYYMSKSNISFKVSMPQRID